MERFNEACNYISDVAWVNRTFGKIRLQKILYYEVRERFGLSAQMVWSSERSAKSPRVIRSTGLRNIPSNLMGLSSTTTGT